MSDNKTERMEPISGEMVEADGVYANEWGRQEQLERGEQFPADPILGSTEWKQVELVFDNHHAGQTDPRLIPHDDDDDPEAHMQHPRRHTTSKKKRK